MSDILENSDLKEKEKVLNELYKNSKIPKKFDWFMSKINGDRIGLYFLISLIAIFLINCTLSILNSKFINIVESLYTILIISGSITVIILFVLSINSDDIYGIFLYEYQKLNRSYFINGTYYRYWFLKFNKDKLEIGDNHLKEVKTCRNAEVFLFIKNSSEEKDKKELKENLRRRISDKDLIIENFKIINRRVLIDNFTKKVEYEYEFDLIKYNTREEAFERILDKSEVKIENRNDWRNCLYTSALLSYSDYLKLKKLKKKNDKIEILNNRIKEFQDYQKENQNKDKLKL